MTRTYAALAQGLRYGHGINYVLKIDGIDVLFAEVDTGTAPSGYTIDGGSLVVDASAAIGGEIDRRKGFAKSMSLSVGLRDTDAVEALFRRPSYFASLTSDLAYNGTTVNVDTTSGWPASADLHIGHERLGTYSTKGGTSFTLSSRAGAFDVDGRSYAWHADAATGQLVTSGPYYWRGRQVLLYATHVDPYGANHETDILTNAAVVFRGRIINRPRLDSGIWTFDAEPIDRALHRPATTVATGKGRFAIDEDPLVRIDDKYWRFFVRFVWSDGTTSKASFDISVMPWSSRSVGDMVRASALRKDIEDEWATQIAAYTFDAAFPTVSDIGWRLMQQGDFAGEWTAHRAFFTLTGNSANSVSVSVYTFMPHGTMPVFQNMGGGGLHTVQNGELITSELGIFQQTMIQAAAFTVDLDSIAGDAADLPASGVMIVEVDDHKEVYEYSGLTTVDEGGGVIVQTDEWFSPGLTGIRRATEEGDITDVSVTFGYKFAGSVPHNIMTLLESSGRADNGTYDTEPASAGYDIAAVDEGTFDAVFGDFAFTDLTQTLLLDNDASAADLFGGLLALSQRAVVLRETDAGDDMKLTAVYTGIGGGDPYTVEITDSDLAMIRKGRDPIRPIEALPSPNVIDAGLYSVPSSKTGVIVARDGDSQRALGTEKWPVKLLGFDRSAIEIRTAVWSKSLFRVGLLAQVVDIDVVPWLGSADSGVRLGDTVSINIDSDLIRSWSDGTRGYSGLARVLGLKRNIRTGVATLRVLIDGVDDGVPLCPAAQVENWSGTPGVGETIDLPGDYYPVFRDALDTAKGGGNPFTVYMYKPGDAWTGEGYTIDAVSLIGGGSPSCELTVASVIGSPSISTSHFVTFPATGTTNTFQDGYMHEDSSALFT